MKAISAIVKRNLLVYLKDKESVFYTFLSMIIIIILMLIFMGDLNIDIVKSILKDMDIFMEENYIPKEYLLAGTRNPSLDDANARTLVLTLIIGGITIVNGVSSSMGMLSLMSWDEETGKLAGYYVAPISRFVLVTGYILSAICLSVIFSVITVLVSEVLLVLTGGTALSLIQSLKVLGLILLNAFSTTSFLFFLTSFARTRSAFSGIANFVHILSGFVAGMYIPISFMPKIVRDVLVFIPITEGSAWLRNVFTEEALQKTFAGLPKDAISQYEEVTGITMKLGNTIISPWMQFALMFGSGIIFIIISSLMMRKKNVRDR